MTDLMKDKMILFDLSSEESSHFMIVINKSDYHDACEAISEAQDRWQDRWNADEGYDYDLLEDVIAFTLEDKKIEFCFAYYKEI